jgi:putative redox protein
MDISSSPDLNKTPDVIVHGKAAGFLQNVVSGKHQFQGDEPVDVGGTDAAPTPYDYLLTALGTCTSMTIGWYARKKKIPVEDITVSLWQSRIHAKDCENCITKDGMLDRIDLEIALTGQLTPEQRSLLMEAAAKCPVHRTLTSEIDIRLRAK